LSKSSSASGAGTLLASRYAASFIDVASQAGVLETIYRDISELQAALADSAELRSLVRSPVYGAKRQAEVMAEISHAGKFHSITANFLSVLAANRRLNALDAIIRAFYLELAKRQGEVEAQVRTAHPLTAEQETRLSKELAAKTGQSVRLVIDVDESLLGGMVVTIGSQMIDDSLKTKLSRLQKAMMSNSHPHTVSLKEVG